MDAVLWADIDGTMKARDHGFIVGQDFVDAIRQIANRHGIETSDVWDYVAEWVDNSTPGKWTERYQ